MFLFCNATIAAAARFATLLAITLFAASPAWALPADGEKFKDWTARCETDPADATKRQCVIAQTVIDNESQQNVMSFVVAFPPKQDKGRLVVVLPLGADLRAGIEIKVDGGAPTRLDFGVWLLAVIDLTGRQRCLTGTAAAGAAARIHIDAVGLGKLEQ